MFTMQDHPDIIERNKRFYKTQKEYCLNNNIKLRKRDYLSQEYYQYLTEEMLNKTDDKFIKDEFSVACDILIRHNITSKQYINYNEETKNEFYSYAQFRIFNYGLKTYNPEKAKAFVYMTSCIQNGFKQIIKDDIKQKKSAIRKINSEDINSYISNIDSKNINEFESEYFNNAQESIRLNIPLFIQDLYKKYKNIKPIRISDNPDSPRFQRTFTIFDYFLPVEDSGICIEYIDIFEKNEDAGISKNYYLNKMIKARENGYQTFFLFSDIYNDKDIDDSIIFSRLDRMIEGIRFNYNFVQDMYTDYSGRSIVDPMMSYIPKDIFFLNFKDIEPEWFWLDTKRTNRGISEQSINSYQKLKEVESEGTRVYNCGKLILN